jgi:hypothetical protein
MATTLNRQDFARLLQDRLIAAGEDRPLEYDAAGYTLIPRGTHGRSEAVPLDPFHRMYLAAPQDLEFVVKQFVEFWKAAQKHAGAATAGPTFVSPAPAAKYAQPTMAYVPQPRGGSSAAKVLLVIFGGMALLLLLVVLAPIILVAAALHAHKGPGPPPPPIQFNMMPPGIAPPPGMMPGGAPWPMFPGQLPEGASVTEVVGGRGGGEQDFCDPAGRPLLGVAYAIDEQWDSNGPVIGGLQPVFDSDGPAVDWRGLQLTVVAGREGYVVGGLLVDAGEYVNAIKVIFVRRNGEVLDLHDSYESDWLGKPRADEPRKLAGDGQNVIGLHCKQGLVLDGLGLVVRPAAGKPSDAEAPLNPFESPEAP